MKICRGAWGDAWLWMKLIPAEATVHIALIACKKLFLSFPQRLISQLMCLTKSHIPLMRRKRMHMTKMNRIYTFDIHFCLRPFQVERKVVAID